MNLDTALRMAKLCQDAYTSGLIVGGHGVILDKSGDELTLAIRGTDSLREILEDANIMPSEAGPFPGLIHSGFAKAFSEFWGPMFNALPPRQGMQRVNIAGHSLGAALAILAAWRFQTMPGWVVGDVYLFGCPRLGNAVFAAAFNKEVLSPVRVINHADPFCHVPSCLFGWRHVAGPVAWISKDGTISDTVDPWQELIPNANDHAISAYVNGLTPRQKEAA